MMKTRRARKPKEPTWYWVFGLRKLHGVKVWYPLYCSRTEAGAQQIERMCRSSAAREQTKDGALMAKYRDFRVIPDTEEVIRCVCTSNYLKRIRKGDLRLWKCLNCGNAWEREALTNQVHEKPKPVEPSTMLSKARKASDEGADTSRRRPKAQKKPQRPVSKRNMGRKLR